MLASLPRVVELLSHRSAAVRLMAVQSLALVGRAALPHAGALRSALARESDEVTAKTLAALLAQFATIEKTGGPVG